MDDALLNCMTGVCCPPEAQAAALAEAIMKDGVCAERDEAAAVAKWILKHFDLAPADSLRPLVKAIVRIHRAK